MKKRFLFLLSSIVILSIFSSCTSNGRAKTFGGTVTIKLPAGQKLVEATWKDANLWYLMEPMDSSYVPKVKTFKEDSHFGIMEGTVIFVESK